jgi:hypothetical protein
MIAYSPQLFQHLQHSIQDGTKSYLNIKQISTKMGIMLNPYNLTNMAMNYNVLNLATISMMMLRRPSFILCIVTYPTHTRC